MRLPLRPLAVVCFALLGAAFLAAGCSSTERQKEARVEQRWGVPASPRVVAPGQPVPKGGGTYKVGQPYQVEGQWHTPREQPDYDRTGLASYYAEDFHGRRTSNGEIFDMWSLSVVLYECLTGMRPFTGKNATEMLASVTTATAVPPSALRPECPAILDEFFARALHRRANRRFPDAAAMQEALRRLRAEC